MVFRNILKRIGLSGSAKRKSSRSGRRDKSRQRRALISDLEQHLNENLTHADRSSGRRTVATGK